MTQTQKRLEENELKRKVYDAIEDYIFEHHKLCSITEISEQVGLGKTKCRKIVDDLVKKGEINEAFTSGKTNPRVYIPTYMMNEILRVQSKPRWLEEYSFEKKKGILEEIEKRREDIKPFEMFERLLYATNTPLEETIAFVLNWLEFKGVVHFRDNPDNHDIEFKYNGKLFLVEVKGKSKEGDKDDIQQLEGWIKRKIINENMKSDELEGLFIINHYRKVAPEERGDPLTPHAREFLKLNNFKFITTPLLFNLIKKVLKAEIIKEIAREEVVKGEKI